MCSLVTVFKSFSMLQKQTKSLEGVVAWKQKDVEIRKLFSNVDSFPKGDSLSKQYSGVIHSAKLNAVQRTGMKMVSQKHLSHYNTKPELCIIILPVIY